VKRVKWFDKKFNFDLNKRELTTILSKLKETPERIDKLVVNLSEETITKKTGEEWSIKENIGHLIDLEELHSGRIDDFIAGKESLRPADLKNEKTYEAGHNEKDIRRLLREFRKVREDFIKRFSDLDQETLTRNSLHPRLKQKMRPIDLAQFILEHDKHHMQTIRELIKKHP
jgi:uncharacterized damage-inducible protein DinB